jgi:hypothetical protein
MAGRMAGRHKSLNLKKIGRNPKNLNRIIYTNKHSPNNLQQFHSVGGHFLTQSIISAISGESALGEHNGTHTGIAYNSIDDFGGNTVKSPRIPL